MTARRMAKNPAPEIDKAKAAEGLKEAERRIEKWKKAGDPSEVLNLSGIGLAELPESLCQLTALRRLDLSDNHLTSLPESLCQLKALEELYLYNNQLSSLPESLGEFTALTLLSLDHNQLTSLPEILGQLAALTELSLDHNQLTSLPEILGQLSALTLLYLDHNQLTSLPKSLGQLTALTRLYLHGNPGLGLSEEVLGPTWEYVANEEAKPADPRAILDFYFSRQQEGEGPLNQVKLLLLGRGEAGKTSVSRALRGETFSKDQRETPGIEIKPWNLACPPHENVMVHLWDLAGQEITHETHRFFLTDRSLYLVVLDGRGGQQMEEAEYWLSHVKKYGSRGEEHSPVIVVLNKWDSPGPYDVEQRRLQRQYPNIKAFVKTDCKTSSGIDALRETICAVVEQMPGVRQMWPASYKRVATELRNRGENPDPTQRKHFLSWQDYRQVCEDCGVKEKDRQHYLAENLNALGIALYYGDDARLRDTRVLNPNWAANGLYGIVRGVNLKPYQGKRGLLWAGEFAQVLTSGMDGMDVARGADIQHYPEEIHGFLLDLMVDRELGFQAGEVKGLPLYLLPGLLSVDEPEVKDYDIAAHLDRAELRFRYLYELLPAGVMSRFIVRTHSLSEDLHRWKRGVLLEWGNARALVMAESLRNPRVDIAITGGTAEERQELAGVVRANMEVIHRGLPDGLRGKEELDLTLPGAQYKSMEDLEALEKASLPVQVITSAGPQSLPVTPQLEQVQPAEARLESAPRLKVFISYAHANYKAWESFKAHLDILKNNNQVDWWFDGKIRNGSEWDDAIRNELKEADIVILLLSNGFFASKYIQGVELQEARRRQQMGEAEILPVLLEPCAEFGDHPWLKKLQTVPSVNGQLRPMTTFNPRVNGWHQVDQALRKMIAEVAKQRREEIRLRPGRLGGRIG